MTSTTPPLGPLLRDLAPQVLGAVARRHGDFAAAEDAVQEALIAAAEQWAEGGIPDNPRGWLYRVAMRRLTDQIRSEIARMRREEEAATLMVADAITQAPGDLPADPAADDTLVLLFMCCHPSLSPASAIALTLRAVGGLTTTEIARAFLVPDATMGQRISRAKQTIRDSGVGFEMPSTAERAERLAAVLQVLYLIYNEGYATSGGNTLQRADLAQEAIRLARMLHALLPDDAEVAGLLALLLLTDARSAARTGADGELIPLDEQDRSRWSREQIDEGTTLVRAAMAAGPVGPYLLQAAIAAVHDRAASVAETDWGEILTLYGLLRRVSDSPMVALSEAIAEAEVHGAEHGLERLEELGRDRRLAESHRLDAVRGHLLERLGRSAEAIEAFTRAAGRTASAPERHYLLAKAARLRADGGAG